jgi:hypothetical protein
MLLSERIRELTDAGFSGLWIQTAEPDEAIKEIEALCTAENYECTVSEPSPSFDPIGIRDILTQETDTPQFYVLPNFAVYLQEPVIRQSVYRAVMFGKTCKRYVLILSPSVNLPPELEKVFTVVEHDLPTREDLNKIGQQIGTEKGEMPKGVDLDLLLDAAAGLTRYEAEGAFSLSLVRTGKITPATVWEHKEAGLKKSGLLSLHRGGETFDRIGGLDPLKEYLLASLDPKAPFAGQGCMLVGVPGTGKSTIAKALGSTTGRPVIVLDIGRLMTKFVGESGQNMRQALKIADAMAPCVLFLDEIEKALAGQGTDTSGTKTDIFGTLLTWLNDHTTPVYVIGTSNSLKNLPSALTRSGRIDSTWFLDYPDAEQRATIWPIYLDQYKLKPDQARPKDDRWTGAEIRACCKEAAQKRMSIIEASKYIIPVSLSGARENEELREEAQGKYIDANTGQAFTLRQSTAPDSRRTVTRRKTDPE